eukprot:COSAG05_NODE_534_length_8874_cov_19.159544_4_plen_81_part_00
MRPGYITEKILLAFVAGAIPIYYGTDEVFDICTHPPLILHSPFFILHSLWRHACMMCVQHVYVCLLFVYIDTRNITRGLL